MKSFLQTKMKNIQLKKSDRLCCVCDKKLFGRSDKVFCNIQCKNKYHSEVRKNAKNTITNNINILKKNYNILCSLLGENCHKFEINKLKLQELKFDFSVITGIDKTNLGIQMKDFKLEVFEFKWYQTENDTIVISRQKNHSNLSPYMYKRWVRYIKPLQTDEILDQVKNM
jgi:hypothetical protein